MRTDKIICFLDIAERWARQGTCLRRNFGAVLVNDDNHIISTGYTGAPCNEEHCTDIGKCWRQEHNIPSGTAYEKCRSVHAEMNALLQAGKQAKGATLFLAGIDARTGENVSILPCFLCIKMIINAQVKQIWVRMLKGKHRRFDLEEIYEIREHEAFQEETG